MFGNCCEGFEILHFEKTSHQKKIKVIVDDLYICAGRNSAYTNHHIPSSLLTPFQLETILAERHTKDEWCRFLYAWNTKAFDGAKTLHDTDTLFTKVGALIVNTAVTPARKHESIYEAVDSSQEGEAVPGLSIDSSLSSPGSEDSAFEAVSIPIASDPVEDILPEVLSKWDSLVYNVNLMSGFFKKLRTSFGDNINVLQDKVNVVDSKIGVNPLSDGFEDCLTTWQGLTDVHQGVLEITSALPELQRQVSAGPTKDFEALKATTRELELFRANTSAQINELKVGLQRPNVSHKGGD